jgi:hypothetical protein
MQPLFTSLQLILKNGIEFVISGGGSAQPTSHVYFARVHVGAHVFTPGGPFDGAAPNDDHHIVTHSEADRGNNSSADVDNCWLRVRPAVFPVLATAVSAPNSTPSPPHPAPLLASTALTCAMRLSLPLFLVRAQLNSAEDEDGGDRNEEVATFKRKYTEQIRQCEEMQRRLRCVLARPSLVGALCSANYYSHFPPSG